MFRQRTDLCDHIAPYTIYVGVVMKNTLSGETKYIHVAILYVRSNLAYL